MACFKPAMLPDRNQDWAFYGSSYSTILLCGEVVGIAPLHALRQKLSFVQIPDAAVTNRGRETIIESNASRHERTRTVPENRYSAFINIVSGCEVIHDVADGRLQIRTPDYVIELCAGATSQKVYRQQRYPASAGIARHLIEILFLSMAWFADANDRWRLGRRAWSGQEIAFQWVFIQPWNLDDLTGGRPMFERAARACPHACEHGLPPLISGIEREYGRVVIVRCPQPVTLRGQKIATRDGPVGAFAAGIRGSLPFQEPGFLVPGVDPARGEEAFGNGGTTFLSGSQQSHEFSRKLFVVGPMDPSFGIEPRSQVKGPSQLDWIE